MVDVDLSVFDNPNLGQNNTTTFLDEVQAQALENHHAQREGRDPRKVAPRERFGPYKGLVTNGPLKFEDGVPAFDATDMNDYWQNWENGVVAADEAKADSPVANLNPDESATGPVAKKDSNGSK